MIASKQPYGSHLWMHLPLKRIAAINPEVLPEDTDPDFAIVYVDIGGVSLEAGIRESEILRFGDAPSRARRLVKAGDTIVSTVRTYLRAIAPVIDPPNNMVVSTGFAVVRSAGMVDSHFLSWALRSSQFVEAVVAVSVGVSYPAIAPTVLGCIPVRVPPKTGQRAIAGFLDRETAKIDALIAKHIEFLSCSTSIAAPSSPKQSRAASIPRCQCKTPGSPLFQMFRCTGRSGRLPLWLVQEHSSLTGSCRLVLICRTESRIFGLRT